MTQTSVTRDLDAWLQGMGPAMTEGLHRDLPGFAANADRASLEALEATLLERLPDKFSAEDRDAAGLVDTAARYIGETLIWKFEGCFWRTGYSSYEGVPILAIPDGLHEPTCPEQLIDAVVRTRTGNVLTEVYDSVAELVPSRSTPLGGIEDRYRDATMPPAPTEAEALAAWLAPMPVALEDQLPGYLPADFDLSYDRDSLDRLEAVILTRLAEKNARKERKHAGFIDRCARYVGEVYLRAGEDAHWAAGEDMYRWYPVVAYDDGKTMADTPISLVTAAAQRKRGTYLSGVFGAAMETARPRITPLAPLSERYPV